MTLLNWIINFDDVPTATVATPATVEHGSNRAVANVAIVADTNLRNWNHPPNKQPISLDSLLRIHPPIVEGCKIIDILALADPSQGDYEALMNWEALTGFARSLRDNGKITVVGDKNEE